MTLAEFAEYFETCTKPGQAILNMISLEFRCAMPMCNCCSSAEEPSTQELRLYVYTTHARTRRSRRLVPKHCAVVVRWELWSDRLLLCGRGPRSRILGGMSPLNHESLKSSRPVPPCRPLVCFILNVDVWRDNSDSPLAEMVQSPQLVRDIDWVNQCWPEDRKQEGGGQFPKVTGSLCGRGEGVVPCEFGARLEVVACFFFVAVGTIAAGFGLCTMEA